MTDFPDTDYKEEIMFFILKASYSYAEKSIEKKQNERYKLSVTAYDNLIKKFPESKYKKEADKILKDTNEQLSKL